RASYAQAQIDAREQKLEDVESDATKAFEELSAKIPRIAVRTGRATATVQIDAVAIELKDGRAEVEPGKHTIVVTAPGRESFHEEGTGGVGEEKVVEAPWAASEREDSPAPSPAPKPPAPSVPAGAVVLTVAGGGVAVAGGVLLGLGVRNGTAGLQKGGG